MVSGLRQSALTICIVLLASCGGSADGKRPVRLGAECYRIPDWNALPMDATPVWLGFGVPKSTRSLSLQFSNPEIARWVPGYPAPGAAPDGRLLAGFFVPSAEEHARQKSNKRSMHFDIWYALGDYKARTLEPIAGTDLYRIYPLAGGPTWMVVTRVPDLERRDTHLQQDFWLAGCHMSQAKFRSCSLDIDVGTMFVTLHIDEADLPQRQELLNHVLHRLKAWQVPCD